MVLTSKENFPQILNLNRRVDKASYWMVPARQQRVSKQEATFKFIILQFYLLLIT
jgi:hypothetical protein